MHSEKSSLVLIVMMFRSKKVLQLLEHVCLRMDPLKDAVGSSFGKADNPFIHSGNVLVQSTHPGPQPRVYMGLGNLSEYWGLCISGILIVHEHM